MEEPSTPFQRPYRRWWYNKKEDDTDESEQIGQISIAIDETDYYCEESDVDRQMLNEYDVVEWT